MCDETEPTSEHGAGHMRVLAVDVGGSGVKHAWVDVDGESATFATPVELITRPRWDRFGEWLAAELGQRPEVLAVASAGLVDSATGVNHYCAIARWRERPLGDELSSAFGGVQVAVMNDVEAHLYAHIGGTPAPVMLLAAGTSVGIAVADSDGRIVQARAGYPLQFGAVRLGSDSVRDVFRSALGKPGLMELEVRRGKAEGVKRFGSRTGDALARYAVVFSPRTVVLSGGLIEHHWDAMEAPLRKAFSRRLPRWLRDDPPAVVMSEHGRDAALIGASLFAYDRVTGSRRVPAP